MRIPNTLGVVVARRKSKRLPDKVLRPLGGIPLVAWSVKAAAASSLSQVVISTDDGEIAEIAKNYGASAPFLRPAALAEDFAEDHEIVLHALREVESIYRCQYQFVVLLQATSPFISPSDINACLDRLSATGAGCVFTVRRVREHPEWMFTADESMKVTPLIRRLDTEHQHAQRLKHHYIPNGAAYGISIDQLRKQKRIYCEPLYALEMPTERSIDIDEASDLDFAEVLAQRLSLK